MAHLFHKFFPSQDPLLFDKQDKILLSITEEQDKAIANTIKMMLKRKLIDLFVFYLSNFLDAPRAVSPEAGDHHFDMVIRTDTLVSKFKTNSPIPEMVKASMEAQIAMAKRQAEAQVMRANANSATIRTIPLLASGLAV